MINGDISDGGDCDVDGRHEDRVAHCICGTYRSAVVPDHRIFIVFSYLHFLVCESWPLQTHTCTHTPTIINFNDSYIGYTSRNRGEDDSFGSEIGKIIRSKVNLVTCG